MRFDVSGSRAGSGELAHLIVDTETAQAAKWLAWRCGVMATKVKASDEPMPLLPVEVSEALAGKPVAAVEMDDQGWVVQAWVDPPGEATRGRAQPAIALGEGELLPPEGDPHRPIYLARYSADAAGTFFLISGILGFPIAKGLGAVTAAWILVPSVFLFLTAGIGFKWLAFQLRRCRQRTAVTLLAMASLTSIAVLGMVRVGASVLLRHMSKATSDGQVLLFLLGFFLVLFIVAAQFRLIQLIIRLARALPFFEAVAGTGFQPLIAGKEKPTLDATPLQTR